MAIIVFVTAYLVLVCYCHPDAVSFLLRQSKAKCQQLLQQLLSTVANAAVGAIGRRRRRRQEKQLEFRVHLIDCESVAEFNSPAEEEHCITPPWYQPSIKLEEEVEEDVAQAERTQQCQDVVVVPEATMTTTTTMTTPPTTPSPTGKRKLSILVNKLTPRSSPRKFKLPYPSFPRVRVDARQE